MNPIRYIIVSVLLTVLAAPVGAFEWRIFLVDTCAKPTLDIQPIDGFPHIAYMTEALSGYVRHSEWNGASFDITEVATGYF